MPSQSEQALQNALQAYIRQEYPSIRAAARAYNVSFATLARRVKGGNTRQQARQTQQTLSPTQESLLIQWIISIEAAGTPPTFAQVREFAGCISVASGGPSKIGNHWISRFLKRHPSIRSKVGKPIDYLRIEAATPESLIPFFERFLALMEQYQIKPGNLWNMDETGVAIGICSNQTVLGTSETKQSYKKSPQNRDWSTVIEACSAAGLDIPPVVIFKGQELQSSWFPPNTPPTWLFRCTESAFTSNVIGLAWLTEHFIPLTACGDDVRLLLCDNQGSHISIDFMYQCFINNIQLLYMPSHSSHLVQPLDVGVFSVLKRRYRTELANLLSYVETQLIQRLEFIKCYAKARAECFIPRYI